MDELVAAAGRLALGTAQWGATYGVANRTGQPGRVEVAAIGRAAWEAGVRTLDTARGYGTAEEVIGDALDAHWRVVTKLDPSVATEETDAREISRRTRLSLARSLAALRRERLDVVLLHRPEQRILGGGAAWSVLREEREAGRIGHIGVSVVSVDDAPTLLDDPDVTVIQVPASLLDRRLAGRGFFAAASAAGREVLVRSVFLQGAALLPPAALPAHLAAIGPQLRILDHAAATAGTTRIAMLLGWARHRTAGATILVGAETAAQFAETLDAWRACPSSDVLTGVVDALPALPGKALDPWRWPTRT